MDCTLRMPSISSAVRHPLAVCVPRRRSDPQWSDPSFSCCRQHSTCVRAAGRCVHTAQPWGCPAMQVRPCTLFACEYGKGGTRRRQISVHMLYVRLHILRSHNKLQPMLCTTRLQRTLCMRAADAGTFWLKRCRHGQLGGGPQRSRLRPGSRPGAASLTVLELAMTDAAEDGQPLNTALQRAVPAAQALNLVDADVCPSA